MMASMWKSTNRATRDFAARPRLERLEGREQPGSMLTAGLDTSLVAGALGQGLLSISLPDTPVAIHAVTTQSAGLTTVNSEDMGVLQQNQELPSDLQVSTGPLVQSGELGVGDILGHGAPLQVTAAFQPGDRPGGETGGRGPDLLFYGGDFDGRNGLTNEFNTLVTDSRT